jgi:hypothetical protein
MMPDDGERRYLIDISIMSKRLWYLSWLENEGISLHVEEGKSKSLL